MRIARVYFIKPIGMRGPIKIGCSYMPTGRKTALERWCPFPLEIVAQIEGEFRLERRFHAAFLADHTHQEWFRWSPQLQAVIDSILNGRFDINSLPQPKALRRNARKAA